LQSIGKNRHHDGRSTALRITIERVDRALILVVGVTAGTVGFVTAGNAMTTTIAHDGSMSGPDQQVDDETRTKISNPVGLALRGGGSWGAHTWGVLDRLLASRTLAVTQLSGTSAGALNAAIVASALAQKSTTLARKKLREFWMAIACPAVADIGREIW